MDVCKKIPLTTDFGTVVCTPDEYTESDLIDVGGKMLQNLTFTLTDVYGNVVQLFDIPISFTLAFVYSEID